MAQEIVEKKEGITLRQLFRIRGVGASTQALQEHRQFSNPVRSLANEDLLKEQGVKLDISPENRVRFNEMLDHPDGVRQFMEWIKLGGEF